MNNAVKLPTKRQYIRRLLGVFNHYACAKCGWPVIHGYCCTYCGDSSPDEAEEGMNRITFHDLPETPTPREQELNAALVKAEAALRYYSERYTEEKTGADDSLQARIALEEIQKIKG